MTPKNEISGVDYVNEGLEVRAFFVKKGFS